MQTTSVLFNVNLILDTLPFHARLLCDEIFHTDDVTAHFVAPAQFVIHDINLKVKVTFFFIHLGSCRQVYRHHEERTDKMTQGLICHNSTDVCGVTNMLRPIDMPLTCPLL